MKGVRCVVLLCLFIICRGMSKSHVIVAGQEESYLSSLITDNKPWLHITAGSEQSRPYYIGLSPRQIEITHSTPPQNPSLYIDLKFQGELHLPQIYTQLENQDLILPKQQIFIEVITNCGINIQMWPQPTSWGNLTWVYARYSTDGKSWYWLDDISVSPPVGFSDPTPFFPVKYNLQNSTDFGLVFDDFLELNDLYNKPVFGDCIWSAKPINESGWYPLHEMELIRDEILISGSYNICRVVPQISRFNGNPMEFITRLDSMGNPIWDPSITWAFPPDVSIIGSPQTPTKPVMTPEIISDFAENWKEDVFILSGETPAYFPISKKQITFERKSDADPQNQLLLIIEYLKERYEELEVTFEEQPFSWRNISVANLIVKFPSNQDLNECDLSTPNPPIIFFDHYDTAFCEDIFDKYGIRKSTTGADDNVSAAATLLNAASIFQSIDRCTDIWMVHITGEEYPSDGLGTRHLISWLLNTKQDISAAIVMDMIAHVEHDGDMIFQIAPGDSDESVALGLFAQNVWQQMEGSLPMPIQAALRSYFDPFSYLFNTDGVEYAATGFPVVLINEHMNLYQNFNRTGYHDSFDTTKLINWDYGVSVATVAIETVAQLSMKKGPMLLDNQEN